MKKAPPAAVKNERIGGLSAPLPFSEFMKLLTFPPETGGEEGQGFQTFFLVFLD